MRNLGAALKEKKGGKIIIKKKERKEMHRSKVSGRPLPLLKKRLSRSEKERGSVRTERGVLPQRQRGGSHELPEK